MVIEFATKPDQDELNLEFDGRKCLDKDTGKAWIDLESMHLVRLERRYQNLPAPAGVLAVQVDYAPVVINGKTYWMPKRVRTEQTQRTSKNPVTGQYVAEYSHYQKVQCLREDQLLERDSRGAARSERRWKKALSFKAVLPPLLQG